MPTYEYVCEKCGKEFEFFQSMTDKPLTVCPPEVCPRKKWGKGKVRKMIGAGAGLIFRGSGFYITDYRSESYQSAAKKEAAPASGTSSPASSSATAEKPAAKPAGESKKTGGNAAKN